MRSWYERLYEKICIRSLYKKAGVRRLGVEKFLAYEMLT
jgi:hypothetical protein